MFRFVAIMSFFVVISGNSMTGNFQTCQLQCNNDESGGTYEHPIIKSGPKGEKGSRGDVGKTGDPGVSGVKGDPGVSGVKGDPGVSGMKGDPGVSGMKGDRGVSGVKGDRGVSGMKGDRGVSGVKGDPGVSCNLEEISEMKGKMAQMESDLEKTRKVVKFLSKDLDNKWEICGVGIQDPNVIPDDRMTASSRHSDPYVPHNGRLLSTAGRGGWAPVSSDKKTGWLQVDLGSQSAIYGIVTQGRQQASNEWVTTYQVSYKRNSEGFKYITDQSGRVMVFQGNTDRNTPVQNNFPAPISARYFRVHPKSYAHWPLLRFELLTC